MILLICYYHNKNDVKHTWKYYRWAKWNQNILNNYLIYCTMIQICIYNNLRIKHLNKIKN